MLKNTYELSLNIKDLFIYKIWRNKEMFYALTLLSSLN